MARMVRTRSITVVCAAALIGVLAGPARAQVKRQEILKAIDNAFSTWKAVSCTDLDFKYAGAITDGSTEKKGAIVIYFEAETTKLGEGAYYIETGIEDDTKGEITTASIGLNARKFSWSLGAKKNSIDIQTAILHMIPATLGFYVGTDPKGGSLPTYIKYNSIQRKLSSLHQRGARFTYFKAGAGCTQPAKPVICGQTPPGPDAGVADASAADAGPAVDAGIPPSLCIFHSMVGGDPSKGKPYHWPKRPIEYYVAIPDKGKLPGSTNTGGDGGVFVDGGGTTGDGGGGNGGDDDDGCCRVGHARTEGPLNAALLLLGLGLLLLVRRGRRE